MKKIILPVFVISICALLVACGNPNQRLDEYLFYDGPQFRLKVVRYYRNIPFNQLGEQAVVMCQSENTRDFPAHDQQDAGWRMLGAGDAQGSKNAKEMAVRMKSDYEVFNDHTLIATINVFNISFDACGTFINWDPGRLPQEMIDPVEKPDSCAPKGPADCRYLDFEGDRAPRYEQIHLAGNGKVSFTASSPTFKDVGILRVKTRDNGAVWHVEIAGDNVDKPGLKPGAVGSLPISSLEKGLDDISLMDWFEITLKPRSMVIWSDVLAACDESHKPGEQASPAQCAQIRFNDAEGGSGTLFIKMNTDPEKSPAEVAFHSGFYRSEGRSRPIESLTALREILSAGTR